MKTYSVLKIGQILKFECSESVITELVNKGYKKVGEIEAIDSKDAEARFDPNDVKEEKEPTAYLSLMSMIYLILSLVGCVVLIVIGMKSYRSVSMVYYGAALGNLVITLLVHSICNTLIYIAKRSS